MELMVKVWSVSWNESGLVRSPVSGRHVLWSDSQQEEKSPTVQTRSCVCRLFCGTTLRFLSMQGYGLCVSTTHSTHYNTQSSLQRLSQPRPRQDCQLIWKAVKNQAQVNQFGQPLSRNKYCEHFNINLEHFITFFNNKTILQIRLKYV